MAVLASIIIRDVIANRPAAGIAGRLFFATDTEVAYYDDGTSWDAITIGSGSVASVGLTVPSWLSVAGSPVTSSGTLAVTATGSETANEFLATPDGTAGAVGLRTIVAGDLPHATTGAFGAVKPDGTSITISGGVITAPSGTGTVTSVALTVPTDYSVSGSPITTTGTLAVSENTQSANLVKAGPVSGSAAAPTYRSLEPADLPEATTGAFGAVKPDGATIDISSGVISVPTATTGALGLVKPDGSTITISSGVISGNPGTVTSVALTTPSWLSVSGSPITASGTLAVTATGSETANEFLATPDGTTGSVGLRAIVAGDLPHATTGAFGAVKPDGTSITISSGIISAAATVTSVALTVPSWQTVGGSPITSSGTLVVSDNTQAANQAFSGPASGSAAAPGFRALVAADLPLATTGAFGAVKPDGTSVDITTGVISVPTATGSVLGLVKPDNSTITISSGVISSTGTVSSVALTVPSWLSVGGSPITTSGTLAITATSGETANEFLATPDGTSGAVGLRTIVPGDLPLATTGAFGVVKPDGSTITISTGVISSTGMVNPMTTAGDLIIGDTGGAPTRLAAGTSGDVLTSNGPGTAFAWAPGGGGGSGSTISTGSMASFIASPPAGPSAGDTFICTDIAYTFTYTGSVWQAYWHTVPVMLPAQATGEATTLSGNGGSIDDVTTTLNVAGTFAKSVPFLAVVDTEVVKVTSKGSGTDWTIVRGYDSTAASHTDSTAITLLNWQEINSIPGLVTYPGSGSPTYGGLNVLSVGSLGATYVKTLAPSTPYTLKVAIQFNIGSDTDNTGFGLAFREQSTGAITSWDLGHATTWQFQALKMTDPNTVSAPYTVTQPPYVPLPYANILWLELSDSGGGGGSALEGSYSFDMGGSWKSIFDVSRTDFTTPDEIGFWVYSQGDTVEATLLHWQFS